MPAPTPTRIPPSGDFAGKAWQQVLARDPDADGQFVYAVRSTRIFCKPSCPSRRPTRRNVSFFTLPAEAEAAGYRACLRCRPNDGAATPDPLIAALAAATDYLQANARHAASPRVTLLSLASSIAIEPATITRAFDRILGVTPAQYARTHRLNAFRDILHPAPAAAPPPSITDAIYAAGFGSSSRLYEGSAETLGMTPSTLRSGGAGATVHYTLATSPLGRTLIAATAAGVCAIAFGDSDPQLRRDLEIRFPKATRRELPNPAARLAVTTTEDPDPEARTARWLVEASRFVLASLSEHPVARAFPLDVRATAFQTRIWAALQAIPRGETRSYAAVAQSLGQPSAARAVATACAANPVALAIPCHRVVGATGALTGYRWGVDRKRTLLSTEKTPPLAPTT
jgi:AraC family transcriptional regulator of adaptative response/methylated-DNA-[protein]-cysteine methyltransferase